MYFLSCFLFLVMFLHCAFWVVHDVRLGVRKNAIFSRETIRCFLAPALSLRKRIPYLSANRLAAEISTSKLANSKQQMSKSIQQFLKCTLISSPLVRWKWPTQVRILGTLWWGWDLGMMQSTTSAQVSKTFFRASDTAPGWPSEKILVIWLAIWQADLVVACALAGWLCGGLLASWLALWLFGWLPTCLSGWLAIWLGGCLPAYRVGWPTGWLASWLADYLAGYLAGWLAIWLAI